MKKSDLALIARVVAHVIAEQPRLKYSGVYVEGRAYRPGEFVTRNGSLWHCNTVSPSTAPGGAGSNDWTLAVKRGRDARREE